ncbi:phospholipase D-like domain-containing protein [Actinocorallia sp. API 0066]|uniref:phospholipase D-like domain-containing protein n=1 Tax=Actinocorallia sp. API 0066 TaxID=2896846 RepID=UPI001E29C7A3|nr:phospholipase D-like domain-containing protein [Actinocorallia sp. API 0066]MCD0450593.1 phospholipase D-like domain-containing protein [Actinocorallia sp. API 0066]
MASLRSLVLTLLAASVLGGTATSAHASGGTYTPAQGALFSRPTAAGAGSENVIRDHLIALIDHASPGSSIKVAMYLWRDKAITDALVRAKNRRKVTVQVIMNNSLDSDSQEHFKDLRKRIGTYRPGFTETSWAGECVRTWGCLGTGIHHNKFFLFSRVGKAKDVVVQSSANLTLEERTEFWNNAYTVADSGLYGIYDSYFERLREGVGRVTTPDDDAYTHAVSGRHQLYTTPSAGTTDPISDVLDQIVCSTDPKKPTRIRVAMFKFGLIPVAERLAALKATEGGHCRVRVVYGNFGTNLATVFRMEAILRKGTNLARVCEGLMTVHSKYMTIDTGAGSFEGVTQRKVVFTGSFNYMPYDLRRNDETVLRIDDRKVHDQYVLDFEKGMVARCSKPWWKGDRFATR